MKADFFITYHHNDELAARWIAGVLKEVLFSILMDSWDFLPGNQPLGKIEHMTAFSRYVLVLLSQRFLREVVDAVSWNAVMETFSSGGTKAVLLFRIDSCEADKLLGTVKYTNLFGMKEAEARKRLLTAVGAPTADKKEPVSMQVTAMTREEVLEKIKTELYELLKTTIKNQYHMKLDLEQEIEKEVEVEDEKTGKIEKWKQWVWEPVKFETVLTDRNNYILVNPSGMGKTTFLNYAACLLLDRDGDYPFVPLFTTCITLNNRKGSIADFIQQRVESFYNNSQTAIVQRECENLCILLDALDQSRDVDDIVASLQIHDKYHYFKKAKILLSSRQNTADRVKTGFKKIRLKLPEDKEVKHYLGEENYKKLESHIAASRELVTVPVLLEMLKNITEKGYKASRLWNRADLYTEFTRILIDQERSKPRFWQDSLYIRHFIENELEQALEKIAFFSLAENKILEIEKDKLVQYCETPEKKEALLNIGIILELFEDREQKIVFRHQSFQAYFAARYMYFRRHQLFDRLISDICFFYHDVWYEVMRFFVGLEKDPDKAGTIINSIYQTGDIANEFKQPQRLIFSFFLMSEVEVKEEIIHEIYNLLRDILKRNMQYLNFISLNIDKFNIGNDAQRRKISIVLGPLFNLGDWHYRRTTAEILGKLGTPKDISFLKPLLLEWMSDVRIAAIEAVGNIGTPEHVSLLKPLLMDKKENVRHAAAKALWNICTPEHVSLLKSLIRDKDEDARNAASLALAKVVTPEHVYFLMPLLRDDDEYIQIAAFDTLITICTPKHISLLKPLLRDKDENVRCFAAEAVGKIGTSEHVSLLKPLLRDKDEDVRSAAAEALENIYTPEQVSPLKSFLRDKDEHVGYVSVESVGNIGSPEHVTLLKRLLKNKDGRVRRVAAKAVGNIRKPEHVSLLKPLLGDREEEVRSAAAEALAKIVTTDHILLLEALLSNAYSVVRLTSIKTLRRIGTFEHIPLLEPLLRDKNWDVRRAAIEAIANIYKCSIPQIAFKELLLKKEEKKGNKNGLHNFSLNPCLHILHISDIHYALEKDPTMACIFHEFLRDIQKWRVQQNNQKIHSICLTGDIAQSGQKNQYESINEKINDILNTTGCSKEHLFIIPGNHDVREYDEISHQGKTTLEEVQENKMNIDSGVLCNFENYREFHEKFKHYYEFVETSGYVNSLPFTDKHSGSPKPWFSRKMQDFPVRIIGLNSALFCLKEFSEYGKIRMGANQFHEAYFQGKPGNIPKGELVILLTHHPVNWLAENEYEDYTTLMERYGIIHLHGHIHKTKIVKKQKLFSSSGGYVSIGTGSLYGEKGEEDINTYHIITFDFENQELHVWARRWNPDLGEWTVYHDDGNNRFPLPHSTVLINCE